MMGSIVSNVSGYGTANARTRPPSPLSQGGVVDQVFCHSGAPVVKGDPLYVITSAAAEEALAAAKEALVESAGRPWTS